MSNTETALHGSNNASQYQVDTSVKLLIFIAANKICIFSYLLAYLLNIDIDIDIAIFRQYVNMVSISYRNRKSETKASLGCWRSTVSVSDWPSQ